MSKNTPFGDEFAYIPPDRLDDGMKEYKIAGSYSDIIKKLLRDDIKKQTGAFQTTAQGEALMAKYLDEMKNHPESAAIAFKLEVEKEQRRVASKGMKRLKKCADLDRGVLLIDEGLLLVGSENTTLRLEHGVQIPTHLASAYDISTIWKRVTDKSRKEKFTTEQKQKTLKIFADAFYEKKANTLAELFESY